MNGKKHPKAFCDTAEDLVSILKAGAAKDAASNPSGTKYIIEIAVVPDSKPPLELENQIASPPGTQLN